VPTHVHVKPILTLVPGVPPAFGLAITRELIRALETSRHYRACGPLRHFPNTDPRPCPDRGADGEACLELSGEIVRRAWYGPNRVPEISVSRVFLRSEHERFEVGLNARVVDLSAGAVLLSSFLEDLMRSKAIRHSHVRDHAPYAIDPPPQLGDAMARHAWIYAHRMVDLLDEGVALRPPLPGTPTRLDAHVVEVDLESVAISAGARHGVVPSEILSVYRPQRPLVDRITGEHIGDRETFVGEIRVMRVREDVAEAHPVAAGIPPDLSTFRAGDIVRRGAPDLGAPRAGTPPSRRRPQG
jgi:hypothetical protein